MIIYCLDFKIESMRKIIINRIKTIEQNFKNFNNEAYFPLIENAAKMIINALRNKKKIMFCGNGGSAADSQHLSAELLGRYLKNRKPYASIALTTDTSVLTAISNDLHFNEIFSRQVSALTNKNDILFAITTSGKSKNILLAIDKAKKLGAKVILLSSSKAKYLKKKVDLLIPVPADRVDRIQEMHISVGHIICELVEKNLN